ncbi:glycine cleavage system H-protein subunit [Teratosphaeriaceae sp. CCFEE 6253]|nr:glycine cleavage system H-protein subunit [Teratosphaeriaceae sp. CCFEE 6253]
MAAIIAGSGAAAARLLQRPVQEVARCSRQQYLRLRAQHARPAAARSFTAGRQGLEKKFTEDHEWIDVSSPDSASIGISTYAAKALGDVVYVELPTVDTEVSAGDAIGAVESVKSASDIMTPVGGTILEVNSVLEDKPGTINKSPEGDGWLAKIKVADVKELERLMDADAYRAFTEEVKDK